MSDDGPSDGGPRMGHHGNKSKSPVLPDYGRRPASASEEETRWTQLTAAVGKALRFA
jgi:hypothetical protein